MLWGRGLQKQTAPLSPESIFLVYFIVCFYHSGTRELPMFYLARNFAIYEGVSAKTDHWEILRVFSKRHCFLG